MSDATAVHEILGPAVPLVVIAGLLLWLVLSSAMRRSRRTLMLVLLAGAAACPLWALWLTAPESFDNDWVRLAGDRYERLWSALDTSSLRGARALRAVDLDDANRLELFRALGAVEAAPGTSLILIDPETRVVAWAGEGLLHPVELLSLPSTGPAFYSGFTAVTVASVRRVGRQSTSWRLLCGRSFSTQRLPFRSPSGGSREDFVWTVIREGGSAPEQATVIEVEGRPSMSILPSPESPHAGRPRATFLVRISWLLIGLVLILAGRREARQRSSPLPPTVRPGSVVAGVTALAIALGVDVVLTVLLFSALTIAATSARRTGLVGSASWWPLMPLGAIGVLMLLAFRLEKLIGPIDLGSGLTTDGETAILRLVAVAVVLAGILPILRHPSPERRSLPWAWTVGIASIVLGVGLAGMSVFGIVGVVFGALVLIAGLRARGQIRSWVDTALIVAIAALVGASTWEVAYRALLARYLERDVTPVLGPPGPEERSELQGRVEAFFATTDLLSLAPADPLDLDEVDLAYALWNRSPLTNRGWLSAVSVAIEGVLVSSFEFGVPLDGRGRVDTSPELWQALAVPGWEDTLIRGESRLGYLGEEVGTIRYALLPRPGFRLQDRPTDRLASRLVEGDLATTLPIDEVIAPAKFAVYEDRSRPSLGPRDAPPLPVDLLGQPSFFTRIEGQRLRGWTHRSGGEVTEVVLLATPGPLAILERMGIHLLGTGLLTAALALLLWLAGGLRIQAVADAWHRVSRSYSNKLLVLYGTLLLLPLLMLSIALLGVLGDRLGRSQELAGESAMESAQHVLGEYVLSLEPGFGVDTALDDALLGWLSRVINHEVNLYWGSSLYASSNPELFAAGFLPTRIPGEIYSQLALESARSASRLTRANRETYVELYAPLRIPGIRSQEALFLSIPLLAQQHQAEEEIALLRTRAVLVAVLLLIAVVAVGSRVSQNFTRPLMRLIDGTQAIAAGASSIDLEPTELELAALVNAINDMAGKIADARERLLREKQVMEKMVQNITAGIVSLDSEHRVLLLNRVAAEILDLEVGESLRDALERNPRLQPLSEFLAEAGDTPIQTTLVVHPTEAEEREWSVVWVPLPGEGEPTSLLVVEDISEVLRGQRLQAWAEMARMIAHEIKNPLTPIRLSAEHMVEVRTSNPEAFDEVFERCSRNILLQVDELHEIASEFSTYSRIPQVQKREEDLVEAVREVVDSYRAAPPQGIDIELECPIESLSLPLDRRLFGRALRNLLENALRASADGGSILVSLRTEADDVLITVSDRGPGVDSDTLVRMFDPYFSADSGGTGLGLPISRSIVEQHDGTLTAANRPGGGLAATVRLPVTDGPEGPGADHKAR